MLTIKQILRFTKNFNATTAKKARTVGVAFTNVLEEEDKDGDVYMKVLAKCKGETKMRSVELHIYGKGESAKVWVRCDCPWFKYACEYPTSREDSTTVKYSKGGAGEKIVNPNQTPAVCKHIWACFIQGATELKPKKTIKR